MPELSIDAPAAKSTPSAALFILADTSGSMAGKPVATLQSELEWLVGALRGTPGPGATLRVSLTTVGQSIDTIRPLAKLSAFSVPHLSAGGFSAVGEALQQILPALEKEPRAALFILGDGQSTDDCAEPLRRLKQAEIPVAVVGLKPSVQTISFEGNWIKKIKLSSRQDARGVFAWLLEVSKSLCDGALNRTKPGGALNWPAIPKQNEWLTVEKEPSCRTVVVPATPEWPVWHAEWDYAQSFAAGMGLPAIPSLEKYWHAFDRPVDPASQYRCCASVLAALESHFPNGAYPVSAIGEFAVALASKAGDHLRSLTQSTKLGEAYKRVRGALHFSAELKLPPEVEFILQRVVDALNAWQLEMDQAGGWFLSEFIDSPQYATLAATHDLWMQLPDNAVVSKNVTTNICSELEQFLAQCGVVRDPVLRRGALVSSLPVYLKSCAMPQANQVNESNAIVGEILCNRWYRTDAAGNFIGEIARACFVVAEATAPAKAPRALPETAKLAASKTEKIKPASTQGPGKVFDKFVVRPQGSSPPAPAVAAAPAPANAAAPQGPNSAFWKSVFKRPGNAAAPASSANSPVSPKKDSGLFDRPAQHQAPAEKPNAPGREKGEPGKSDSAQ